MDCTKKLEKKGWEKEIKWFIGVVEEKEEGEGGRGSERGFSYLRVALR